MSYRCRLIALSWALLVLGVGCGGQAPMTAFAPKPAGEAEPQVLAADGKAAPKLAAAEPITRKIIYTADIEIVVKDLEATRQSVERIVQEQQGYIAKTDTVGQAGQSRTATWTMKVPAEKFQDTVAALAALGNTVRNSSDSQDVTEEYFDLESRIKNYKAEEEVLNRLLKEKAEKVEDLLKIREQIKIVRVEIERAEGRLKYLATMAAMSTITLRVREDVSYVPPTAPTFGSRISDTFEHSLSALSDFGKGLVLLVVALAPWLPLILIGAILARWVVKRLLVWAGKTYNRAMSHAEPALIISTPVARPVEESDRREG